MIFNRLKIIKNDFDPLFKEFCEEPPFFISFSAIKCSDTKSEKKLQKSKKLIKPERP